MLKKWNSEFNTMTAGDAKMNGIIWIHISSSLKCFSMHLYIKDYATHEGVSSHLASVRNHIPLKQFNYLR